VLSKHNKQIMGFFFLLAIGIISYLILQPFLISILSASIFAVLFRPAYSWLHKFIHSKSLCALIISIIALLLVIIPISFLSQAVFIEIGGIVHDISSQNVNSQQIYGNAISFGQSALNSIPGIEQVDVKSIAIDSLKSMAEWARIQIFSIPTKLFFALLSFFLFFYLLRDGDRLVQWVYDGLPLSKKNQQYIDSQLQSITYVVVYGQIVTAIIQGLIAMFGYWLFGIHAPVLWGIATMFFSLLPLVGTAVIWVPASIYFFVSGLGTQQWLAGVGLFLYGALIIAGLVDYVIRPMLIGASSRIHPAIALIGVIGGVVPFGFIGVFAGPLILALFISLYDILIRKVRN